jgi:hypothetical protein
MTRVRYLVGLAVAAVLLLGLATADLQAQTIFGVRGGVTVANLDSNTFDSSNRTGFAGGVFLDFGGSGLFGFQLGAQYNQKGAELDLGDTIENLKLDYLEIPAVVKVGIPLGPVKPSVLGGVGLGFNTSCSPSGPDCDDAASVAWHGILGADLAIYLGGISLWADGRYNIGVNDLFKGDSYKNLKDRAWTLQAGIGFGSR